MEHLGASLIWHWTAVFARAALGLWLLGLAAGMGAMAVRGAVAFWRRRTGRLPAKLGGALGSAGD